MNNKKWLYLGAAGFGIAGLISLVDNSGSLGLGVIWLTLGGVCALVGYKSPPDDG